MARSARHVLSLVALSLSAAFSLLWSATRSDAAEAVSGARIAAVSAAFLGRPYQLDPLGEGEGSVIDPDPLWRTDSFDCLTFVETVMALAQTHSDLAAHDQLQRIRYRDGRIGFDSRNHFPEADWITNNVRAGFVSDVTPTVARTAGLGGELAQAHGIVHRAQWLRSLASTSQAKRAAIDALVSQAQDAIVDVPYLRLRGLSTASLRAAVAALPDGAILFIVRPNTNMLGKSGAVTQLSHVGFALRNAAGVVLYRNASSTRAQRVLDTPFLGYLRRMQGTRSFAGIVVLRVLTLTDRAQMP